ncbi:MAG: AAA family ATPase [Candidatus Magasanikbacteria bacterium]
MTNNKKIIFGFVGLIASGKGTANEYLKTKHHASTYRFSTMLRDVLNRLYLEVSRENLQKISQVVRENFGEETLSKVIAEDVKRDPSSIISIDGIRRPGDVQFLSQIPGFVMINISADIEKRFERITKRGENTDDIKKTFEQFKLDHEQEAELKIAEIAAKATEQINNNRSYEDLYAQLDALIKKYSI